MTDTTSAIDAAPMLNAQLDGWSAAMGLRFVQASGDEVIAEWTIGAQHLQAYGIVHGGVYCTVIETLASVGAALYAMPFGKNTVGLENHTSFLRAVRSGRLRATGRPLVRGRTSQVWEVTITTDDGKPVASGRVRMLALDEARPLAGEIATGPR